MSDVSTEAVGVIDAAFIDVIVDLVLRRLRESATEVRPLVTVNQLAEHLQVHPSWVYAHAEQLQAIRLGTGPKAPLRFDLEEATRAFATIQAQPEPPRRTERETGPVRPSSAALTLLPIGGR